jgi:hypothetical protein
MSFSGRGDLDLVLFSRTMRGSRDAGKTSWGFRRFLSDSLLRDLSNGMAREYLEGRTPPWTRLATWAITFRLASVSLIKLGYL